MVRRVMLVINQASGGGSNPALARLLEAALAEALRGRADFDTVLVRDHPQAKACTQRFLRASDVPAAIIAGGGGGTLRAVIEGIAEGCAPGALPGLDRVRVAALRMGSGNVVARHFGMPLNPVEGARAVAAGLLLDRVRPLRILSFRVGKCDGRVETRFAAAMCGLGQFGRTSGDLARWHRRLAGPRRVAARLMKIETLNHIEYTLAFLMRSVGCAVQPRRCERLEIGGQAGKQSLRLLAGVVLNVRIPGLPFVREAPDGTPSIYVIPFPGRFKTLWMTLRPHRLARCARRIAVGPDDWVEMRFTDSESVEFFLDEDPEVVHGSIAVRVAGTLTFVPGPGYAGSIGGNPS